MAENKKVKDMIDRASKRGQTPLLGFGFEPPPLLTEEQAANFVPPEIYEEDALPNLEVEDTGIIWGEDDMLRMFGLEKPVETKSTDPKLTEPEKGQPEKEYTGGSVSYYQVEISNPTTPGRAPYTAECNDIIEALGMSFAEGNVFKAIWRIASDRKGKSKEGYRDSLYDAEKVVFFGQRMVEQAKKG